MIEMWDPKGVTNTLHMYPGCRLDINPGYNLKCDRIVISSGHLDSLGCENFDRIVILTDHLDSAVMNRSDWSINFFFVLIGPQRSSFRLGCDHLTFVLIV